MNVLATADYLTLAPAEGLSQFAICGVILLLFAGIFLVSLVVDKAPKFTFGWLRATLALAVALICGGIALGTISTTQMMDRQSAWDGKVVSWLEDAHGIRSDVNTFTGSFGEDSTRTLTAPGIKDGHLVTVTLRQGPRNTLFLTSVK